MNKNEKQTSGIVKSTMNEIEKNCVVNEWNDIIETSPLPSKRIKDLRGLIVGKLLVTKLETIKNGMSYWKCSCICGGSKIVSNKHLRDEGTKSCGCIKTNDVLYRQTVLIGKKFNLLRVIDFVGYDQLTTRKNKLYKCKCDCGNETIVNCQNLKSGQVKSCGCIEEIDLIGRKFGNLIILEKVTRIGKTITWKCRCKCNNILNVIGSDLTEGIIKSCDSCKITDVKPKIPLLRTYRTWESMISRCYNNTSSHYNLYGGRGISVCDRWMGKDGFQNFIDDMKERPEGKTLDRVNTDGNYQPNNCRWATPKVQGRNKRNNIKLTFNNETKCISEWGEELGINPGSISTRLKRGWSVEKALSTPIDISRRNLR